MRSALFTLAILATSVGFASTFSHRHQILFNHVGKAGGGSVRTTFAKTGLLPNDNCCVGNKLVDVWHPYGNLVPQLEHSYIVLNVRDPVDR